ncbi:PTS sugar transporter subunit IIC [Lacticaseibacillus rhamnosus]|uniref:PTS sugar transporter subunit IIC n=1 Tax=Lacticaseibacillus rhamnosus TaxID=47715 RepID=UPI0008A31E56|nr:PTS sugar transporter subunit IIC [Lacticaseibacillus rhamnosus]OFN13551.1 PTS sorbose transporter subunit IIC [Lactobacillus sp. HMSC072E07]MDE3296960.1 PTS sugar transporter subunit IIC [Lacticaseibacillus rhamnosus]MDK7181943.1 PTS sugar transporter subunit IIC [Lacticaseibacillus rhamnosus]MDK7239402.1 PTS sugar transporter subunit IIC [Lacticaseibacillus rhamnosus]MDT8863111.1 PTS sugar transporter subunit IIC [Lacticaseibacillus rhamnosus]
MTLTVSQAIIIAIWIALVESRILLGGATTTLRFTPMMTGLVVGIVLGNVAQAMMIVAAIQLIYMGVFSPGGQMPSEPAIAAAVAVPVALLGGLKPAAAVAIAVPVGLLGAYLYQFRLFLNTFVVHLTDKYAAAGNRKGLTFSIVWIPVFVSFALFVPFMFITLKFGVPVIASFVKSNSGTLLFHILSTIGGGLASIGIALTIYVIGKKNYIPFFLLAYFMTVMFAKLKISMVTYAIIGCIIAFVYIMLRNEATQSALAEFNKHQSTPPSGDDDDDDNF